MTGPADGSCGAPPPGWIRQDEFEIPGVPDSFQRLWTPHRLAYVRGEDPSVQASPGCPFCGGPERADEESLIVHRGERCFVILNLFPYNPGHLLVCPYRHVGDLTDLDDDEAEELTQLTRTAVGTIRQVASPHAFNIGLNLGPAAGGSLSEHLHQHVVPRWNGDANFMPVLAGTKAIMQTLGDTRRDIAEAWPRI
ncbi:HIT domain-containing protein [Kocuria sp. LUK]|uniref:HIT family protein n=1 Tax=Kocuria sp. LUK TaxID=2897828 RepID=UPI001E45E61D|nr:HIT domain-containing protein [Kocuria sp. LUK]MCD1143712.1 HIT domain-containing protein [Kocuria sp. LUK]